MKKDIISLIYYVEGKWEKNPYRWTRFEASYAKSLSGGKRHLRRLRKEYRDTYTFRLVEDRVKIVG